MADFLMVGVDTYPFEGLIPRPSEPMGVPSLFFSPSTAPIRNFDAAFKLNGRIEVSNMIRLVNELF